MKQSVLTSAWLQSWVEDEIFHEGRTYTFGYVSKPDAVVKPLIEDQQVLVASRGAACPSRCSPRPEGVVYMRSARRSPCFWALTAVGVGGLVRFEPRSNAKGEQLFTSVMDSCLMEQLEARSSPPTLSRCCGSQGTASAPLMLPGSESLVCVHS
jgi:hypothetical protein